MILPFFCQISHFMNIDGFKLPTKEIQIKFQMHMSDRNSSEKYDSCAHTGRHDITHFQKYNIQKYMLKSTKFKINSICSKLFYKIQFSKLFFRSTKFKINTNQPVYIDKKWSVVRCHHQMSKGQCIQQQPTMNQN